MAITQDHCEATFGAVARILNEFEKYASSNTEKFTGDSGSHEAEFLGSLQTEYNYHRDMTASVEGFRQSLSSAYERGSSMLIPVLWELGKVLGFPEKNPQQIIDRLYLYMIANTQKVKSRAMTYAVPAQSGNTGTGQLLRLNVDQYDYNIENQSTELKTVECTSDMHSGAVKHEELFEMRGTDANRDRLKIEGSGRVGTLRCISARDSARYLQNPSFSEYSGTTGTPTAITGWTFDTGTVANVDIETTTYYRDFQGDTVPASLKVNTSSKISQSFDTRNAYFDPNIPLYGQVAVYKPSGVTGNIVVTLGSENKTVALSTFDNDAWSIVRCPGKGTSYVTVGGQKGFGATGTLENWFRVWNKSGVDFSIAVTSLSGGSVYVDDVILAPYTFFDGGWYAMVGGATPYLRNDSWTFTDSSTEASIIQRTFWKYFGRYLPHAPSSGITFPEPT